MFKRIHDSAPRAHVRQMAAVLYRHPATIWPLLFAAAWVAGCRESGPSPEVLTLGKAVYHRPASCVTCH